MGLSSPDPPVGFSRVPGSPSFRNAAVNATAVVPLLSSGKDGEISTTHSARSFEDLMDALKRHSKTKSANGNELLLVVPNNSLTRPGEWRYSETPLKAFHWQHGCQRIHVFDGRPQHSRMAHDRLINNFVSRDWIDLFPSRRTAAVIGVLNVHDCKDLADLHRAEEELHQWAVRYGAPPYEVSAHGRAGDRDKPVERLFVYDSFDDDCQKIDLSKSGMGSSILAFPPFDQAHAEMMDLHMNVVVNDLAVAIFRDLEKKIQLSEDIIKHSSSKGSQNTPKISLTKMISAKSLVDSEEPINSAKSLSLSQMASLVSPESKLGKDSPTKANNNTVSPFSFKETAQKPPNPPQPQTPVRPKGTPRQLIRKSLSKKDQEQHNIMPQLLTPMDDIWNLNDLSHRDVEAIRKRDIGRREKYAGDLSLLAGSPLDAYERYLKAADLCRAGTPDPLWYASALEGCAAAHIAMAEAGGYDVDDYLERNFQLPDDIMALAIRETKEEKRQSSNTSSKQTLPEIVVTLCEEALKIINRHATLAPIYAELLLKVARYYAEEAEGHLRCRWGEGEGCYVGDQPEIPRWTTPSVYRLKFPELKSKDGDMVAINTLNRTKRVCELLQQAVSIGSLDALTRADVATQGASLCLKGVKATKWKNVKSDRVKLPRKAAFFATIAAESVSLHGSQESARDLWMLAAQLYGPKENPSVACGGSYGWATLRASCLDALSHQGSHTHCLNAAEELLSLLGEMESNEADLSEPESPAAVVLESNETENAVEESKATRESSTGTLQVDTEPHEHTTTVSQFAKNLRESFTTMTASSSLLAVQSKWADDAPIAQIEVPLAISCQDSLSLPCVWSNVEFSRSSKAQKRCVDRLTQLRRTIPAVSIWEKMTESETQNLPVFVSSAVAIQVEATLELECVKKKITPKADSQGAMATFFNPFDRKNNKDDHRTLVAEEEERAMLVRFGNHFSTPLELERSQLEFENNEDGRVKAAALTFVIPPNAKDFVMHFPFTVLSRPNNLEDKRNDIAPTYEVKGISFTCIGKAFFLPIKLSNAKIDSRMSILPASLSSYPFQDVMKKPKVVEVIKPRIESHPCQPWLEILFSASGSPIESISIGLADGELFTLPPFRLQNYAGPNGGGSIERLEVIGVGLPAVPDKKLFDSDIATEPETEEDFVADLFEMKNPPPLKVRALASSLKLDRINGVTVGNEDDRSIKIQIAGAHNMSKNIPRGGALISLRFRYRGASNPTTEVWRRREVALRIIGLKGPRISTISFRPDVVGDCCFAEFTKASFGSVFSLENQVQTLEDHNPRDFTGLHPGVYVCSDHVALYLTVGNDSLSEVTITSASGYMRGLEGQKIQAMLSKSGVSTRVPLVIPRIAPVDAEAGKPVDIIGSFIELTTLKWHSSRSGSSGMEEARGRFRISREQLQDIVEQCPSFYSHICSPPCSIRLRVEGFVVPHETIRATQGSPLDLEAEIGLSSSLPEDVLSSTRAYVGFACMRRDLPLKVDESSKKEYIWVGKLHRIIDHEDDDKGHRIRIIFTRPGLFAVSVFARLFRKDGGTKAEEVWWAPFVQNVLVSASNFVEQ